MPDKMLQKERAARIAAAYDQRADDDDPCPGCEWCGAAIICMAALVGLGIILGSLVAWVLQ